MLLSSTVFRLASLPYELLASAPVWERHCAQMAAELPRDARHVLDLGCGPGNSTVHLGRHAVGGDSAMPMLRRARRRGVTAAAMDAGALPVRSGSR
jgi:trans-aconitate methyltransferase